MRVAWLCCAALATLGCGETKPAQGNQAEAGANAGGSGSNAAGNSSAGGAPSAGQGPLGGGGQAPGGSSGAPSSAAHNGSVTIQALLFNALTLRSVRINANFPLVAGSEADCRYTPYGNCSISHCTFAPSDAPRQHAGTITVDGPEASVHVVSVPDDTGHYSETESSTESFSGGEAVTIVASGGTLPGFTVNGQFPLLLLVSEPAAVKGGSTATATAPRTAPLTLTWTRGAPNVFFHVQPLGSLQQPDGSYVSLGCSWDSMAGTGTIDAAALAELPPDTTLLLLTTWEGVGGDTGVYVVTEAMTPEKTASVQILVK